MTSLKKLFQKLRTILWYLNTCIYIVILQENGVFSWFSDHYTLSFGWDSYFVAESYSVLHCASAKVQWSCLLWSAEFIDPLYTKSSHCAILNSWVCNIYVHKVVRYNLPKFSPLGSNWRLSHIKGNCIKSVKENVGIFFMIYNYLIEINRYRLQFLKLKTC